MCCRTAQQCPGFPSPSAVITAPRDAPLYHSTQLPLMLRQERVYLFLFAVALLCCDMLWYSCSEQRWSNLNWSAPHYTLLTFTDNTALPGFLYFYTCSLNVSLHWVIISINFPPIYVIRWALTHSARSYLCINGWQSARAHTHTQSRVMSQWGHKHTNNISRTALRITSWAFHRFIWVKLSSYHIHTEM